MRRLKRSISKAKTYTFHPWEDQIERINEIVKNSGIRESITIRKLIDDALIVRHHEISKEQLGINASGDLLSPALQDLRPLLLKMIGQVEACLRAHEVTQSLLHDIVAELGAGRRPVAEQRLSTPKKKVMGSAETNKRSEPKADEARDLEVGKSKATEEKLSIARVAEVIGVHPATVSRLMDSGKLGFYQIGTRRLVGQNHLKQYLLLAERKARVSAIH